MIKAENIPDYARYEVLMCFEDSEVKASYALYEVAFDEVTIYEIRSIIEGMRKSVYFGSYRKANKFYIQELLNLFELLKMAVEWLYDCAYSW